MKTKKSGILILIFIVFFINNNIFGQEEPVQEKGEPKKDFRQEKRLKDYSKELDLKMQVLDSKLELFETKLKLLESTPNELDKKFEEINSIFLNHIDSVYNYVHSVVSRHIIDSVAGKISGDSLDLKIEKSYKSAIKLNINRIFEGTLQLSYERAIRDDFSIDFSLLATYVTRNSIGDKYFENQLFSIHSSGDRSYYTGQMIIGLGGIIQTRNYLLPKRNGNHKAPLGLYASPHIMYRKATIKGMQYKDIWDGDIRKREEKEITQNLYIGSAGVVIGYSFPLFEVLVVDLYVGSVLRLSKYHNEPGLTKYKKWNNIDYSGVLPTAGISIGILK